MGSDEEPLLLLDALSLSHEIKLILVLQVGVVCGAGFSYILRKESRGGKGLGAAMVEEGSFISTLRWFTRKIVTAFGEGVGVEVPAMEVPRWHAVTRPTGLKIDGFVMCSYFGWKTYVAFER